MELCPMRLVTHNGRFHYDEVLSTSMLLKIYPDAEVVRTRDPAGIEEGDVVYDVGSVFDPETRRFDHHQSTFFETFSPEHNIKLSSSGLVFKYFHRDLLSVYGIDPTSRIYDVVVEKAYCEFFLYADAIDNGYDICCEIRPRSIADMVGLFNPEECTSGEEDRRFHDVLEIVSRDLENYMKRLRTWADSYEAMEEKVVITDSPILVLDRHYSTSLVLEVESKHGKDFKFMVFPSGGLYKVIAIPRSKGTFETKNPLKKEWRGLRDEELSSVSGIEGCVFVHSSGFMGINRTFENAMRMCEDSMV